MILSSKNLRRDESGESGLHLSMISLLCRSPYSTTTETNGAVRKFSDLTSARPSSTLHESADESLDGFYLLLLHPENGQRKVKATALVWRRIDPNLPIVRSHNSLT